MATRPPKSRRPAAAKRPRRAPATARRAPAAGKAKRPRTAPAPAPARAAPAGKKARRARSRRPVEQPLGVGQGDAFALKRLNVPPQASRARTERGVREVGWSEFGELARELAERIETTFSPQVVLGVVNGGVFLGGALSQPLEAEFRSIKVEKRGGRPVVVDRVGEVRGKSVLVVDDVTVSGDTLRAVAAAAERAGARETRTATLVVRPDRHHSDFHALETKDIVVFGWDYQLHGGASGSHDPAEVGV